MSSTHRTPKQHNYYSTLVIAVFPLAIYFLQFLSKFSTIAACASGILVVLKILVELRHHRAPRRQALVPHPRLVRVLPPVAGCYLCKELRPLRSYEISGHRVGVCQDCHRCMAITGQHA